MASFTSSTPWTTPPNRPSFGGARLAATWGLLAGLYVGACLLGLRLAIVHPNITAVWPGTGIALAAILALGYRVWPGIFLGAFVVNVLTPGQDGVHSGVAACLGIASGNTLEGILGAFLVNQFAGGCQAFASPSNIFRFLILGALVSPLVSATFGAVSLGTAWDQWALNWGTWWLGDAMGALIVAPPLILWSIEPRVQDWNRRKLAQVGAVALGLALIGVVLVGDWLVPQEPKIGFMFLPLVIWVVFTFGQRGIATVTLFMAVVLIVAMHFIHGTPGNESADRWSMLLRAQVQLQTFLAVTSVTGLTLAAVVAERNRSELNLRETREKLERRVQERTADLARTNDALRHENNERRQVEQALRANEEHIRLIIETAYDAYVAMDAMGQITDWNAQAEKTFGWSRTEVLGRSLTELIIPLRHRANQPGLKKFLESGETSSLNQRLEFSAWHRSGREFPVELTFWVTPTVDSVRFNAFIHDITERKRAEQKFRDLLESAPDAMVIVNSRGEMVLVNAQTETMFGYARAEILGKPVEMLVPEGLRAQHQQHRREYFQDPGVRPMGMGMQLHGRHKEGHEFPVEISLSPLKTEEGTLVSSAIRDITVRQETEEKLRQAERLAAIGEMIAGLAHESRNALQQSQACLELLALKVAHLPGGGPDIAELVNDVQKAQDHLHYLYEEVRGYAAPIKLHLEQTDLQRLLTETWDQLSMTRNGRRAKLIQVVNGTAPDCSVDPQALKHVLRNLLENSLDACPDPVEIRARFDDAELKGKPALRLTLADNGPGLAPEARKKLFQPFFTTKIQGTGLGLAITRRIVEAHQGQIAVADNNHGMEILITLPRA